ncbi:hypothetical protein R3P38DRAFT_3628974 [Favolaschia claudopus]|uniref:Uncharacterized protein n=1 Tax=Favolaschia claudopus TaxID=2862362 RepID=A0AAV9ZZ46_9AGAR
MNTDQQLSNLRDTYHALHNDVLSALRTMVGDPPSLNAVRDRALALASAAEMHRAVFPPDEYATLQTSITDMVTALNLACHDSMDPPDAAPLTVVPRTVRCAALRAGLVQPGAPVFQSWTNDQGQVEVVHTSTAPPVSVISDADLLFLASDDASSLSLPRRHIYTYRGAKKQLWSITPFPTNSQGCPDTPDKMIPTEIAGDARRHMLFSYIVQQPLRSLLDLWNTAETHTLVVPCYGDSNLPEYYAIRDLKNRMLPPVLPGARRAALSAEEAHEESEEYAKSVSRKRSRDGNDENEPQASNVRKPKKKRLSADKRLALTHIN